LLNFYNQDIRCKDGGGNGETAKEETHLTTLPKLPGSLWLKSALVDPEKLRNSALALMKSLRVLKGGYPYVVTSTFKPRLVVPHSSYQIRHVSLLRVTVMVSKMSLILQCISFFAYDNLFAVPCETTPIASMP
jgi:hypothetical protein